MNSFGMQKRNKQNLKTFISMLSDYQQSLNSKVDDLVSHIINYSKKTDDPLVLPEIKHHSSSTMRSKSQSRSLYADKQRLSKLNKRQKSINSSFSFMSEISENMEQKINTLKKSVATSIIHENMPIIPEGRSMGNKKFIKPKILKKQPQIIPRQLRLDPFAQKNIIKAQDLDKGIMSLLQKGKIAKDVDIITAFQKGGQVLNTKQAIFHHGEERLTRQQPLKPQRKQVPQQQDYSNIINKVSKIEYESNSWAITMPENDSDLRYESKRQFQKKDNFKDDFSLQQTCYIQMLHYSPIRNSQFSKFIMRNQEIQSQICSLLMSLQKLLQKYSLQVVYVNSNILIQFATLTRKVTNQELISCVISFQGKRKVPLKQIANIKVKKEQAVCKLQSFFKMIKLRKGFLRHMQKLKVQSTIYNWLYNLSIKRKFKVQLQSYRTEVAHSFLTMQQMFRQNFKAIQSEKHFEIHISNKSAEGKVRYREILNTEITRIFNFQNLNTYIIIILSEPLNEETKNYYYKIMELQEISNYKDRVTFFQVKNYPQLAKKNLSTSQKLYYDSKMIRELKRRIGNNPAYFRISYPSETDIQMSSYFQIPILTGNLSKLMQIQRRSNSVSCFGLPQLKCFRINPNQMTLLSLSSALAKFCQSNKRYKNYVIKINGSYQSNGIGLLTYPFESVPNMYANTAFIINTQNSIPSQFYRKLCKRGGIVQVFQQSLTSIVLMGKIDNEGKTQLVATFDKISFGFVNVGYFFPQMTVSHHQILPIFNSVSQKLVQMNHFGDFQISLFIDQSYNIFFDKIQCYQTDIGASLFYFKFLCQGSLNSKGQYITKIAETFQTQDNKEEQLITLEPRSYCYLPFILHFGLSDKQIGSFFQLCRMGGISFDLQNKFGSTFILLGSLKNSMGMITTARDRQTCKRLMLKGLEFIIKQNSHNNSNDFIEEKQRRMKERENIIALKQRFEDL